MTSRRTMSLLTHELLNRSNGAVYLSFPARVFSAFEMKSLLRKRSGRTSPCGGEELNTEFGFAQLALEML